MQTCGYLLIHSEKVLVLVRASKHSRVMKVRKSGNVGKRFDDEEVFLAEHPEVAKRLMAGEVVIL